MKWDGKVILITGQITSIGESALMRHDSNIAPQTAKAIALHKGLIPVNMEDRCTIFVLIKLVTFFSFQMWPYRRLTFKIVTCAM